jgi:hypothetical protein
MLLTRGWEDCTPSKFGVEYYNLSLEVERPATAPSSPVPMITQQAIWLYLVTTPKLFETAIGKAARYSS